MNAIKGEMVDEVKILLMLITSVNRKLREASSNKYKIFVNTCSDFASLAEFSKDLAKGEGNILTPDAIQRELEKITDELQRLKKLGYSVDISGRRPNGSNTLYLESMSCEVTPDDYGREFYTTP